MGTQGAGGGSVSVVLPLRDLSDAQEAARRLPKGWGEVVGDGSVGLRRARNHGSEVATGSILVHMDDDMELEGRDGADLSWFLTRPSEEVWWSADRFVNGTEDDYTSFCCAAVNFGIRGYGHIIGSFRVFRRWAWEEIGGVDEMAPQEDEEQTRRARRRFGLPTRSPFWVTLTRPTVTVEENRKRYAEEMARPKRDGPWVRIVGSVPRAHKVAANARSAVYAATIR